MICETLCEKLGLVGIWNERNGQVWEKFWKKGIILDEYFYALFLNCWGNYICKY